MDKIRTTVKIYGVDYPISGYETAEYMKSVGNYVDKLMRETKSQCFNLDTSMLAILTAMNLADENIKLKKEKEELEKELNALKTKNYRNNYMNKNRNRR